MKAPVMTLSMTNRIQVPALAMVRAEPPVNVLGAGGTDTVALLACVRTPLKFAPSLIPPTGAHRR